MTLNSSHLAKFGPLLGGGALLLVGLGMGLVLQRGTEGPSEQARDQFEDASTQAALPGRPEARPAEHIKGPIQPIPDHDSLDMRRVAIGRRLFHDTSLSQDGTISCASCHDLTSGGDDGRSRSIGVGGAPGGINAPTVLNARFNFRQFWDGRASDLEAQVDGPLLHPAEMATTWEEVVSQLRSDPSYAQAFQAAYGRAPDPEAIRDAIATFERSLITPGCDFDRYLMGDEGAISDIAKAGYQAFVRIGCTTCHQGVNVGGNMFQQIGVGSRYFDERGGDITSADLGRFNVTGYERDRHAFRVAPLRNVALTAPYMHDGSVATLEEAVQVMARHQIGEDLTNAEVAEIVAFLNTLTGDLGIQPNAER